LSQGATVIFLGWCTGPRTGRHYYVRQLWHYKGRSDLTLMDERNLTYHGALCGWALARVHARTGDPAEIAGYLGDTDSFDRAILQFSVGYARTTEHDHAALVAAISDRRIDAIAGL
jgi:hypothetical protein